MAQTAFETETLNRLYKLIMSEEEEGGVIPRFRFIVFSLITIAFTALLTFIGVAALRHWGSSAVIEANLSIGWELPLAAVIAYFCIGGFGEWLLHLKVLHRPTKIWPLRLPFEAHDRRHHELTKVQFRQGQLHSEYAIDSKEKTLSATFPIWVLTVLWPITLALALPFQLLLPNWPILAGTAVATTFAVWIYETKHALDHFPDDWWREKCRKCGPVGWLSRCVHMPHLIHHLHKKRNLNVVGFFLILVADLFFGTYRSSKELYLAWLNKDTDCDAKKILASISRQPWSFQIKDWLKSLFKRPVTN